MPEPPLWQTGQQSVFHSIVLHILQRGTLGNSFLFWICLFYACVQSPKSEPLRMYEMKRVSHPCAVYTTCLQSAEGSTPNLQSLFSSWLNNPSSLTCSAYGLASGFLTFAWRNKSPWKVIPASHEPCASHAYSVNWGIVLGWFSLTSPLPLKKRVYNCDFSFTKPH